MEVKTTQAEAVRNFYRKQGAEQEQLRIIKLLEERLKGVIAVGTDEKTWYWIDGMNDAIALIKGENK